MYLVTPKLINSYKILVQLYVHLLTMQLISNSMIKCQFQNLSVQYCQKVKPARRTFYVDEDEVSSDDKHSSLIVSSTKHANLNKEGEVCNQASEDLGNPMNYTTTSNQTTSIVNSVANNVGVLEHDDRFCHNINSNSKTDHAAFQSQSCSFRTQSHKGIETSDNMSTLSASADPTTSPKLLAE